MKGLPEGLPDELQQGIQHTQTLIQRIQDEVQTSRRSSATHLHVFYKGSDMCKTIDIRGGFSLSDFIGDIVFARCDLGTFQEDRNTFAISFVELIFEICTIVSELQSERTPSEIRVEDDDDGGGTQLRELGPNVEKLMNKLCGIEFPSIFKLMFSHDELKKFLRRDQREINGPGFSGTSPEFFRKRGGIRNVLSQPLTNVFNITTLSIPTLEKKAQDLEERALSAVKGMSKTETPVEEVAAATLQNSAEVMGSKYGSAVQMAAAAGLAGVGTFLSTIPPLSWAGGAFLAGAASAALNAYNGRKGSIKSTLQQGQLSGGLINMCIAEMYHTENSVEHTRVDVDLEMCLQNFFTHCVKPRILECIPEITEELLQTIFVSTFTRLSNLSGQSPNFFTILGNFRYSKYEVSPTTPERVHGPERPKPKLYVKEIIIKDKGPHIPPKTVYHESRRNMQGQGTPHKIVDEGGIHETFRKLAGTSADNLFKVTVTLDDPDRISGLCCLNYLEEGIAAETDYIVYLVVDGKDELVFPEFNTVHDYMPLIASRNIVSFYKNRSTLQTKFKVVPTNGKVRTGLKDYWRPDMCGYEEFTFEVPNTRIREEFMNVKSLKRRIQYEIHSKLYEKNVRFRLGVVGYSHFTRYQDGYGRVKDIGGVKLMIEDNSHPLLAHLDIHDLKYVLSILSIHTKEDAEIVAELPSEDILKYAHDLMQVLEEVDETLTGRSFSEGSALPMIEETSVIPEFMSLKKIYELIQTIRQPGTQFKTVLRLIVEKLDLYARYIDEQYAAQGSIAEAGDTAASLLKAAGDAEAAGDGGTAASLRAAASLREAAEAVEAAEDAEAAEDGDTAASRRAAPAATLINIPVTIHEEHKDVGKYRWYDIVFYTENNGGVFIPPHSKYAGASLSTGDVTTATMPLNCFTKPFFIVTELVDTLREIEGSVELDKVLEVVRTSSGTREVFENLEAAIKARNIPRPYEELCNVCVPQSYRNPPPPYCSVSLPCVEKYELKFTGMFKAIMEPLMLGIIHVRYANSELGTDRFRFRNSIIQHALYDMTQLAKKLAEIGRPEEDGAPTHAYDTFIAKILFSLSCVKPAETVTDLPERLAEDILEIRRILNTVKPPPTQGVLLEDWGQYGIRRPGESGLRPVPLSESDFETLIENGIGPEMERLLNQTLDEPGIRFFYTQ